VGEETEACCWAREKALETLEKGLEESLFYEPEASILVPPFWASFKMW